MPPADSTGLRDPPHDEDGRRNITS